jgi:predicted dehydrogenase
VEIIANLARGPLARLRFSAISVFGPPDEAWIFGSDGTVRLEAAARRLSLGRRGDKGLAEVPIPAEQRIGWRVEEEFVNAIRGRETITRTGFEDGVRYMEFTDAVTKSMNEGRAVEVAAL